MDCCWTKHGIKTRISRVSVITRWNRIYNWINISRYQPPGGDKNNYRLKINQKPTISLISFCRINLGSRDNCFVTRSFRKDCLPVNGGPSEKPIQPQLVTRHNNNFGREISGHHVHEITGGRHSLHKSLNVAADICWSPAALGEYPFPPKWPRERLNFTRITPWNTLRDLAAEWRAANSSRFNIESCISVIVSLQIGIRVSKILRMEI